MASESEPEAGSDSEQSAIHERHAETAAEVVPEQLGLYIGGEWVESASGATLETRDPTTGEVLATVSAGNAADIDRAVSAAQAAFEEWGSVSPAKRQRLLETIADRIESELDAFARLDVLDNGKPITEARGDVYLAAEHFRYFAGIARDSAGETVPTDGSRRVTTVKEPYGVVGQIIPWNFPLLMAAWKLAPALAAGNTVVLKPAEQTPLSALKLMAEIDDALPAGVVNVVPGYGPDAGEPLTSHSGVRKLAFTGSTAVGKQVMKNAAETVTDVTLELGGKSPIIVYPDADLETAVQSTVLAIFYNTGECCTAGSRLFVHEEIESEFMDRLVAAAEDLTVGDPLLDSTRLGPKVSEEQRDRTLSYIEKAREDGASILTGGSAPDADALSDGCFVEPTLIGDIDHDHEAVQEEIFGPVLEVFSWEGYEEMIELANDVEYGLASGVITSDIEQANRTARDLEAGTVWVNQYNDFPTGMPFGGYKQSGIGRERGRETLEQYTQTKSIDISL
ncbi:aldehyde dehydrogenase family protein [Halocatena pleomorpha]|uniref:Aldehyde dehydrogenase family protein n=1 Tax=Halocatena pleomorpha TaxID=1785090 RepID=A0A3P3RDJ6_9EURY|nr:aldehyde dehydrogenase family protein [Halocatena pleomorpha]RRJ31009.1 aldehyde dehydrogenase family protein [Halocatena pleomorpha]